MTNIMKEKLTKAIEAKNNDVNTYIWKLARNSNGTQEEIKLMDATPEQLSQFYRHCYSMLYSEDRQNPGRYPLLNIIQEQREKCNVELFLRKLKEGAYTNGVSYPRNVYCQEILECIRKNKPLFPQSELKNISIGVITGGLPYGFANLSIDQVITGCLDGLGIFNDKHITFSFIINLGIYLNPSEMKEFAEKDKDGNNRSKLEVIKERLGIKPSVHLVVKPGGLNFTELRAMINLKSKKYSDLTTDQLVTLRNKVLFRLEQEVNFHIDQWENRMTQIEKVAEVRGIELSK